MQNTEITHGINDTFRIFLIGSFTAEKAIELHKKYRNAVIHCFTEREEVKINYFVMNIFIHRDFRKNTYFFEPDYVIMEDNRYARMIRHLVMR